MRDIIYARLKKSSRKGKKWMAEFYNMEGDKIKTTHFGGEGYEDYTIHKNPDRKKLYISRHSKNEDWTNPVTAGALSRWVLWNYPDLKKSWNSYLRKFKLKDFKPKPASPKRRKLSKK